MFFFLKNLYYIEIKCTFFFFFPHFLPLAYVYTLHQFYISFGANSYTIVAYKSVRHSIYYCPSLKKKTGRFEYVLLFSCKLKNNYFFIIIIYFKLCKYLVLALCSLLHGENIVYFQMKFLIFCQKYYSKQQFIRMHCTLYKCIDSINNMTPCSTYYCVNIYWRIQWRQQKLLAYYIIKLS